MSSTWKQQDGTGVKDLVPEGIGYTYSRVAPTNAAPGYSIGAIWINKAGTPGAIAYINVGSNTSATWRNFDGNAGGLPLVNTAISTAGAGTLTAAGLLGGVITRTGPSAAYSDTTDTAALITAAWTGGLSATRIFRILNDTAFPETILGGTGVTVTGIIVVPPNSVGEFLMTYTSAAAVAIYGLSSSPIVGGNGVIEAATALSTAGNQTISAASIVGGIVFRTGTSGSTVDTTDTAAAIVSALPNAWIGQSWEFTYVNQSANQVRIAQGTGVTITTLGQGNTLIPAIGWIRFLMTYTGAGAVSMVAISSGQQNGVLKKTQYTTAVVTTPFTAAQFAGADFTAINNSGNAPGSVATPTAALTYAGIPNCEIGYNYILRVLHAGTGTLTITAGTGYTITAPAGANTATVATVTYCDFLVTIVSSTTATMVYVGTGTVQTS